MTYFEDSTISIEFSGEFINISDKDSSTLGIVKALSLIEKQLCRIGDILQDPPVVPVTVEVSERSPLNELLELTEIKNSVRRISKSIGN